MARYHFDSELKTVGLCRRKAGNCPFTALGSAHWNTRVEAIHGLNDFLAHSYLSPIARLMALQARTQREIFKELAGEKSKTKVKALIAERELISRTLEQLEPLTEPHRETESRSPAVLLHRDFNRVSPGELVGIQNGLSFLEQAAASTYAAYFELSEEWLRSLTSEEALALRAYADKAATAHQLGELLSNAVRRAPELVPTRVYSGLSSHVAGAVLAQIDSGLINLPFPISTSLNSAQTNTFARPVQGETLVVEIETTVGGSMGAISRSAHEFEVLLPAGTYQLLEDRGPTLFRWQEGGAGRRATRFLKLRRLP